MGNLGGNGKISDEDFNDVFEMFDKDKSGTVEKDEMVDFIKHFLGEEAFGLASAAYTAGGLNSITSNDSISEDPPSDDEMK